MLSPLPLMGSSQTSGGIFHGHACGNIPKHADLATVNNHFKVPVKGEVYLYLTDQYPQNIKFDYIRGESDLVVMVNVAQSMAPILNVIGQKNFIIQSEYYLFMLTSLGGDFHIYYHKSTKWIALGQFNQAMDDDECEWQMSDNETHELHLPLVSLGFKLCFRTDYIY